MVKEELNLEEYDFYVYTFVLFCTTFAFVCFVTMMLTVIAVEFPLKYTANVGQFLVIVVRII